MMNRVVAVDISTASGQTKRLQGIDVKFNVEKFMSELSNQATIELCNLSRDDMEYLTTFTSQWIAQQVPKSISLYAGYEDAGGASLIYTGNIVEAVPSSPPDIWLSCKAITGYYKKKETISKTIIQPISVKELCEQVSTWTELRLSFESTVSKVLDSFSFTGNKIDLIGELNRIGGLIAFEDDGLLNVLDVDAIRKGTFIRQMSEKSGMVGIPKVNAMGCDVTCLLDNSLKIGQLIELESTLIPQANGKYQIITIRYDGHYRGNPFYSHLKTKRLENVTS